MIYHWKEYSKLSLTTPMKNLYAVLPRHESASNEQGTEQTLKQFSLIFQTFENFNQIFLQSLDRKTVTTFFLNHSGFHFILDDCSKVLCSIEIKRVAWPDVIAPKLDYALRQQLLIGICSHA